MFSHLLRLLNLKRAKPVDYSPDEIANADEPYLASMVRAALNSSEGVPHYEIGTGNAASAGETLAAKSKGVAGDLPLSHETGPST